jgi:hypothetical protein
MMAERKPLDYRSRFGAKPKRQQTTAEDFGVYPNPVAISASNTSAITEGDCMSVHVWEHIVKMIEQEQNPTKIAELAKELNNAMLTAEKERVQRRLGRAVEIFRANSAESSFTSPGTK